MEHNADGSFTLRASDKCFNCKCSPCKTPSICNKKRDELLKKNGKYINKYGI